MAITVNHYANDEWSVTGIPIDRNILAHSLYYYGAASPNYPVPAMVGTVAWNYEPCGRVLELIVTDCDVTADPRLCIAILGYRDNEVLTDYPHDSPNYR